jgi:hypothetical protein
MNSMHASLFLVLAATVTGCAHTRYQFYVYNDTPSKITEAKVTLANGESLTFGTLYPSIDKGIWPVIGPLGKESLVEWIDAKEAKKSVKAVISCGRNDDSVIVLINSNDTVTVETGRKLYGHKKSNR